MPNCVFKNRVPKPQRARKRRGDALIEILIALGILAVIVPVSLEAFSTVYTSELRLYERAEKASCAAWWFNRLELPLSPSGLDEAPRVDESGRMRFIWEMSPSEHGASRVTLFVTNGAPGDVPFKETRVY